MDPTIRAKAVNTDSTDEKLNIDNVKVSNDNITATPVLNECRDQNPMKRTIKASLMGSLALQNKEAVVNPRNI